MKTYLEIEEFCQLVHLSRQTVDEMLSRGALNSKEEGGKIYIEADENSIIASGAKSTQVAQKPASQVSSDSAMLAGASFVEKTIGTILNLHEKVLDAKDETLEALKNENKFLKEALYSMQDLYDEDRKTVENLNAQLKIAQDEVEFMRRKYKLMWDKTVENFAKNAQSQESKESESKGE